MRIKKYVADTMPEALKLVKADLGPRAVILNTRTIKKGNALGILGKGQVEVTAAVDDGRQPAARRRPAAGAKTDRPAEPAKAPPQREARPTHPAPVAAEDSAWAERISRQIHELHSALRSIHQAPPQRGDVFLPGALKHLAGQMEAAGLSRALAEEVLESLLVDPGEGGLKEVEPLRKRAVQKLSRRFAPPRPTRLARGVRAVVALVGPPGAGKTTAAARIAALLASAEQARAAFIAADADRVGGLEQLRAYAEILGVPVDAVYTPEEMADTIRRRRDVDLILIDTGGVSPLAEDQVTRLGALLREAGPSEVHLVLSVSTGLASMRESLAAFSRVGADRLLLTKLDETGRLGSACTLAVESELPLSYMTEGRAVPGDLRPADPVVLCRALFGGRPHGSAG